MNQRNVIKVRDHFIGIRDHGKIAPGWDMGVIFRVEHARLQPTDNLASFLRMQHRYHDCSTSACLAGHTQWLLATSPEQRPMAAMSFAMLALGLNFSEAERWFCGSWRLGYEGGHTINDVINFLGDELDKHSAALNVLEREVGPSHGTE